MTKRQQAKGRKLLEIFYDQSQPQHKRAAASFGCALMLIELQQAEIAKLKATILAKK